MDGYYDPWSSHILERPLILCGFYGNRIPEIGAWLSGSTGISFVDIERHIEHQLGCSLSSIKPNDRKNLEEVEHSCIQVLFNTKPFPVVALRPQSLLQQRIAKLVFERSLSIHVHSDIFGVFGRVLDLLEQNPQTRYLQFENYNPRNIRSLNMLVEKYTPFYAKANHRIELNNKHPRLIAQHIIEEII